MEPQQAAGSCAYCRQPLAPSARFCSNCGQELPGRADPLGQREPPVLPEFWERLPLQGRAGLRMVTAVVAALFTALPVLLLAGGDLGRYLIIADLIVGASVTLCAWPERRSLAPLYRRAASRYWPAALLLGLLLPLLAALYTSWLPERLQDRSLTELEPWLAVVSICLFPGVFEELAFRGVVLQAAAQMMRRRNALLLTAALFAAVHFQPVIFPYHFAVGWVLGWLRVQSGSLWPPMICHALHNAAVLFIYSS